MMQRPLLLPLAAMVFGLAVADHTGYAVPMPLVLSGGAALLLSVFIKNSIPFILSLGLFFFLWGNHALSIWVSPVINSDSIVHYRSMPATVVEGVVTSRPSSSGERSSFMLRCRQVIIDGRHRPANGVVLVSIASGECAVARGDRIRCSGRVVAPRLLGLAGEFDYGRFLAMQGVAATLQLRDSDSMVIVRGRSEAGLLRWYDDMALRLASEIKSEISDQRAASVLTALLLGDQKNIPADLKADYSRAGVSHILSISGFHIGIIAATVSLVLLYILCRCEYLALRFNLRHLSLVAALPVMFWYLFLTGAAPATSRAVIMLAVVAVSLLVERETDALTMLITAAFVLILIHPPVLFDISFQLSFCALWGIVLSVPLANRIADRMKFRWQRQVIVFVGASLAASAATAVPVLFTFHQTSLNGVLANFIIVPLLGYGATVLGFVGLVVSSFAPPLASPLFFSAGFLTVLANTVTGWFAALPVFRLYSATALDMALFLLWMSCVSYVAAPRLRLWICSVLPIMAIGIHLADTAVVDGKLHITMLSVGQAESILMRLPDGKAVLVDGGGYLQESERDFGERILAPALRTLGVTHLDTVIITHNHPDHLGGIPYLVESFPVRRVLRTASTADGGMLTQRMMTALVRRQITLYDIAAGMTVPLSADIVLEVLSPSLQPNVVNGEQDVNEESLVFRLHYRSISMLFTADAGFVTEQQLLDRKVPLASTILKVGHHGSRYSTSDDFLQQVKPRIALISAGYGNRFGLPADDTLLQLKRYGTDVYRTDCDGSIELVSDGSSVTVVTPFKDRLMKKLTENSHHAMSMSHE